MDSERLKQIRKLFLDVVERDESKRSVFLEKACGADRELKTEVEKLLAAERTVTGSGNIGSEDLETIETDRSKQASRRAAARGVPEIEGYDMVRELHRGGQGVVYQALQKSTKRKVAIKLLLHGAHATKTAQKRFEREIELVAQLKHPNIISIFDTGSTEDGLPFYVMDYVRGRPLHTHVREHNLSLEEALKLFNKVCEAVQYAHQRGVIHRDLKPTNILVDEDGHPKVLDFGLAKFVSAPVATVVTLTQEVVGTLPYMSPEQAKGNPDHIDTRTDVYSLGVILYELLTGHYPYPVAGQIADVLRNILETAPTPPTKSWKPDSGVGGRSAHRFGSGDCPIDDEVQTIVLKALAKELMRRYQSAGEMARDVEHYLLGEPIDAKRDSGWYLLRKHMARHRAKITLAAAVLLAAAGTYSIVRSAQKGRELARREKAQMANALVQQGVKHEAYHEWDKAIEAFEAALRIDANLSRANGNLSRAMKDRYVGQEFADADPTLLDRSIEYAERAISQGTPKPGPWNNLAVPLILRGRYREAEEKCRKALAIDPKFFYASVNLAKALALQHKTEEAYSAATEAISVARNAQMDRNFWTGDAWRTLAVLQALLQKGDALASLERAVECNPSTCWSYLHRARAYLQGGQNTDAQRALNDIIVADAISSAIDGRIKRIRALALLRLGHWSEAIRYADQAIKYGDITAPNHFIAAIASTKLGDAEASKSRLKQGQSALARELGQADFIVNAERRSLWFDSRAAIEKLRKEAGALPASTP